MDSGEGDGDAGLITRSAILGVAVFGGGLAITSNGVLTPVLEPEISGVEEGSVEQAGPEIITRDAAPKTSRNLRRDIS